MGDKINAKVAEEMIERWQEITGAELDPETQATISRAIRAGRLDFDEDSEAFTLLLVKPIHLENGDVIESVQIEEPTAQQISDAARKVSGDFQQSLKIIEYVSGLPAGIANRMKMRDITTAGAILGFFG